MVTGNHNPRKNKRPNILYLPTCLKNCPDAIPPISQLPLSPFGMVWLIISRLIPSRNLKKKWPHFSVRPPCPHRLWEIPNVIICGGGSAQQGEPNRPPAKRLSPVQERQSGPATACCRRLARSNPPASSYQ